MMHAHSSVDIVAVPVSSGGTATVTLGRRALPEMVEVPDGRPLATASLAPAATGNREPRKQPNGRLVFREEGAGYGERKVEEISDSLSPFATPFTTPMPGAYHFVSVPRSVARTPGS
jgi:hypothetical protein